MKSNRAASKRTQQRQVEDRSKVLLLAAIARRYGEEKDGVKTLTLAESDLLTVDPNECITITRGLPDGSPGVVITLTIEAEEKEAE